MKLLTQIEKVKESNYKLEEVKEILKIEIFPKCKYGNFLLALANTAIAARNKEQENPMLYKNSQEKKDLEKSFALEDFIAMKLGINDDELSNFNSKLLDDYLEEIKTYAA